MKFSSLRGMQDIFQPQITLWQNIEKKAREIFELYNFSEIRTPIIEQAELFLRSIGDDTDIVEKEMYIFQDKKGRSVALRPEATASVVRAYIQHSLFNLPAPQRFYYIGPMFRYERPQKGRFRQFHQIGVEVFGISSPRIEAELIYMLKIFFQALNINDLTYELNSLGCKSCRQKYRENLFKYLEGKLNALCNDCKRRFNRNPLRVLDCKVPSCKEALKDTPQILEFLCKECSEHFNELQRELRQLNVSFSINPHIVRGLDYYTRTVFEVTTSMLGAQNAVAAGGRYDDLVDSFGGPSTPAVGFAIGMERLIEICSKTTPFEGKKPLVYVAFVGKGSEYEAKKVVNFLRENKITVEFSYENSSLKSQLRKADRLGCNFVIVVGEEEIKTSQYKWKNMKTGEQGQATLDSIIQLIRQEAI